MQIFFDLDGTLVDISKRHYVVYSDIVKELQGKPLEFLSYWNLKKSKRPQKTILEKSNLSTDRFEKFHRLFIKNIEAQKYLKYDIVFPFTHSVLKLLSTSHSLHLISFRKNKKSGEKEIESLGLLPYFKTIDIGKSQKLGYESKIHVLKLRLASPHAFIVGDTEDEILAAKKVNINSVAVLSGIRTLGLLKSYEPDFIMENISFLPNLIKT